MSAEKIIKQIKKDAEKQVKQMLKEAENQSKEIIKEAEKQGKVESEKIISNGKIHSENIKKILVSKASQDAKRVLLKTKEEMIEKCFKRANENLGKINDEQYIKIMETYVDEGAKTISGEFHIISSRDADKKIADERDIKLAGHIHSTGGVILKSIDGKITLDNTFEGILKRRKDEIRINVGKLLFSD